MLEIMFNSFTGSHRIQMCAFFSCAIILLFLYRRSGLKRWRSILKQSIEYHKFHLATISGDLSIDQSTRDMAHSLLWGITRQLPVDLGESGGFDVLRRTFLGKKTSLSTCGTVFCECAKNYRTMDKTVFRLTSTLISTLYRIFLLESFLSIPVIIYNDISLSFLRLKKPKSGTGGFYLKMKKISAESESCNRS